MIPTRGKPREVFLQSRLNEILLACCIVVFGEVIAFVTGGDPA